MSDTPRTDAALAIYGMNPGAGVTAFAILSATMERELNTRLAELVEKLKTLDDGYHGPVATIIGIACRYETSMTDRDRDIYNKAVMGIRAVLQPNSSV